jgi:hypothetical protein
VSTVDTKRLTKGDDSLMDQSKFKYSQLELCLQYYTKTHPVSIIKTNLLMLLLLFVLELYKIET